MTKEESLKRLKDKRIRLLKTCGEVPYAEALKIAIDFMEKGNVSEEEDWIPCEDAIPNKSGDYLVTTANEFVCITKFWKGMNENKWGGRFKNCVIAWKDVPKGYKRRTDHEQTGDYKRAHPNMPRMQ